MPLRRLLPVLRSRNLLIALSLFAITTVAARSLMRSGSPHSIRQAKAGGTALQVEVLRSSDPPILARAGATISIQSNFRVQTPLSQDVTLTLSLLDAQGSVAASAQNNLNNISTILPTTSWRGPITVLTSMTLPSLAGGAYSIRLSLNNPQGPLQLTSGPGVIQDSEFRYAIGSLQVNPSAPPPDLLPAPSLNLSGYHLTFNEPFTTLSLSDSNTYNGSRWYTLNEQCCMSTTDGAGTAMVGLASPYNPYSLLPGGGLDIRLQKVANNWTSGVLTSVDGSGLGFSQQYGYFEMKAKFPPGENTWPAFWLLSTSSKSRNQTGGEIDIVEYIANSGFPTTLMTTVHDWSSKTTPAASHYLGPLPTAAFHTYGMMWTADTMTFYFDGAAVLSAPTPIVMQQPYYLLVDLGIGSGWPTDKTPPVNDLQIEYIRAYARN